MSLRLGFPKGDANGFRDMDKMGKSGIDEVLKFNSAEPQTASTTSDLRQVAGSKNGTESRLNEGSKPGADLIRDADPEISIEARLRAMIDSMYVNAEAQALGKNGLLKL